MKHKEGSRILRFRDRLIDEGVIEVQDDAMYIGKNYTLTSTSTSADVISLRSNNRWLDWKISSDNSLDELYRKKLEMICLLLFKNINNIIL